MRWLWVLDYARRRGLKVPQELSIVGFDDIRYSRHMEPALTTISQPMANLGRETVRLLLEILRDGTMKPASVTLPHELVIRASTAAPSLRR